MIRVHLATFNHDVFGIVDQIRFLKLIFRFLNVPFGWGPFFSDDGLNLFIECNSFEDNKLLTNFINRTGKRVGFILTEHIELKNDVLHFNTIPSNVKAFDDYMGQSVAFSRMYNFLEIVDCARKFYTLGDYPGVQFLQDMQILKGFLEIPFPPVPRQPMSTRKRQFEFVFTGARTEYRAEVLNQLEAHFKVASLRTAANEGQRGRLYRNASFLLNIPQNPRWTWSSPMRILTALRYGRTVVSLQTHKGSKIDQFAIQIAPRDFIEPMKALLLQGAAANEQAIIPAYNHMAFNPELWAPLRQDLQNWAIEEGLA